MGCWSSKFAEEYEGKEISSIVSGESDNYSNHRNRSDLRSIFHREKESNHSRTRGSETEEQERFAVDDKPQMRAMTEEDYLRYRDAEEMRMERDLAKDISELELEGENEYMEREMRGIENEYGYEGRYMERDEDRDYETSPDSRKFRRDDARSYYSSDVSSMSSMLSVLHESPEEG